MQAITLGPARYAASATSLLDIVKKTAITMMTEILTARRVSMGWKMKITSERVLKLAEYSDKLANQAKKWNEMIAKCPGASHAPATPGHDEIAAILRWAAEVMQAEPLARVKGVGDSKHLHFEQYTPMHLPLGSEIVIRPEPPEV